MMCSLSNVDSKSALTPDFKADVSKEAIDKEVDAEVDKEPDEERGEEVKEERGEVLWDCFVNGLAASN